MKFLVPLDFSALSLKALDYAALLARKMNASLLLFHAVPVHSVWLDDIDTELCREATESLGRLKEKLLSEGWVDEEISIRVVNQFPLDAVINDIVSNEDIDYVFMGTHGASGLKKSLIGSFTSGMIKASSVPVIAVPDATIIREPSLIVYATDLESPETEIITLVTFARRFDSKIMVLNVRPGSEGDLGINRKQLLSELKKTSSYEKISFEIVKGEDIEDCISCFLAEQNANMLAIFSRNKSFLEMLFFDNLSGNLACEIDVPLLAFKK